MPTGLRDQWVHSLNASGRGDRKHLLIAVATLDSASHLDCGASPEGALAAGWEGPEALEAGQLLHTASQQLGEGLRLCCLSRLGRVEVSTVVRQQLHCSSKAAT